MKTSNKFLELFSGSQMQDSFMKLVGSIAISFYLGWILYHFSNNPTILGINLTCFEKKQKLEKMTNWETILNVIMIINIIGEAIPQAVIR